MYSDLPPLHLVTPKKTPVSKELLGFTYTRPGTVPRIPDDYQYRIPTFSLSNFKEGENNDRLFDDEEMVDVETMNKV